MSHESDVTLQCNGVPLRCPANMVPHIREVMRGEYDVPGLEFATPPRILDVGANCGAFAIWAQIRWPGAQVTCYEPNPEAISYLITNVDPVTVVSKAVVAGVPAGGRALLRFGKNNLGEASFHDLGEQREDGVEVECISARELLPCDVLKADVEGDEFDVIVPYILQGNRPKLILFEFHSEEGRLDLDFMLHKYGYSLVRGTIRSAERGTLAYVRRA